MIDVTTGQPEPCPMCGSASVRWRGRRMYDIPLTGLRWVGNLLGDALGGSGGGDRAVWRHSWRQVKDEYQAELLEANTGLKTPTRFWRCSDCRNRGYTFDSVKKQGRIEDRRRPPE